MILGFYSKPNRITLFEKKINLRRSKCLGKSLIYKINEKIRKLLRKIKKIVSKKS